MKVVILEQFSRATYAARYIVNDTPEEPFTFQFEKPQFQVSQVSFNETLLFFFSDSS